MTRQYPDRFFTYWALVAHALYAVGIFPSTFLVSILVLVGSIFHNLFLNQSYNFAMDFTHHILPFGIFVVLYITKTIPFRITFNEFVLPFLLFGLYLLYVKGIDQALVFYRDHAYYFYND